MSDYDLDKLIQEAFEDPVVRASAIENDFRRWLAGRIDSVCKRENLSVRTLAEELETSVSQVQQLLHKEVGGSLTLRSVMRALVALELGFNAYIYDTRENHSAWKDISHFS